LSTQQEEVGFTPPYFDIIRVGNVGTQINVQLMKVVEPVTDPPTLEAVNLTNGDAQIDVRKSNGTILELPGIKDNPPGVDGKMHYIDTDGIFDRRGRWAIRGVLNMSNGNIFKGSWCGFPVDE